MNIIKHITKTGSYFGTYRLKTESYSYHRIRGRHAFFGETIKVRGGFFFKKMYISLLRFAFLTLYSDYNLSYNLFSFFT